MTLNTQLLVMPTESTAWQITVFVPTGKVLPLGGEQVRLASEQLSEALGAKYTTASA